MPSWPLPCGPRRETPTSLPCWARGCFVPGWETGRPDLGPEPPQTRQRNWSQLSWLPAQSRLPEGLADSWAGLLPGLACCAQPRRANTRSQRPRAPGSGLLYRTPAHTLQRWAQERGILACPSPGTVRYADFRCDSVTQMAQVPPTSWPLLDPGLLCEWVLLCVSHTWEWVVALWVSPRAEMMDVLTHSPPCALSSPGGQVLTEAGQRTAHWLPPPKLKAPPIRLLSYTHTQGYRLGDSLCMEASPSAQGASCLCLKGCKAPRTPWHPPLSVGKAVLGF